MERSFSEAVRQLTLGEGEILRGEGVLAIAKALLQSGVSYFGGYPGAPVAHLLDVLADANKPILEPMGIYFDSSANEAAAAALLGASINYPIRGAVIWKSAVGTNVASDALSHVASAGVVGGVLVIVGEDYGQGASALFERTHAFAMKSNMVLLDPRPHLPTVARLVEEAFPLSEASRMPVVLSIRIRAAHMRGAIRTKENILPKISMRRRLEQPIYELGRIPLPPATADQEGAKFTDRLPAALRYIIEHGLNEHFAGSEPDLGIICQGGVFPNTMRGLYLLGEADIFGRSRLSVLCLNVLHPVVPDEIAGFLRDKRAVLVVEEGQPNLLEQQIRALAQARGLSLTVRGKDVLSQAGEYTPDVVLKGLRAFLAPHRPSGNGLEARFRRLLGHLTEVPKQLPLPVTKRPPGFCTGCPERPVFSALKILERELGPTHYAADIGCHSLGALAPFHVGNTILGYGLGLASAGAVSRMFGKRTISLMGDGGFWHSGLTTGVANAVFNHQDGVLVILENFYTSATGQQGNPSTGQNMRGEPVKMSIEEALRGVGVKWVKTVDPYKVEESLKVLREAATTGAPGLKVVIAKGECQLERQRRVRPLIQLKVTSGARVAQPRFGVDPDVCTGDKSCMRLNGCPSLTLKESSDPLREDPVAHVDQTCVGCGLCGEVAHAATLCPSFYEVTVVSNPRLWERAWDRFHQRLIGWVAGAPLGA